MLRNDIHDLLKFIEMLAEFKIFLLRLIGRPLLIVDVDPCAAPTIDMALFVAKWLKLIKEPPVFAIVPAHPHFRLKGFPVLKCFLYPLLQGHYILWMGNQIKKFHWMFSRNRAEVVQRCAVSVRDICVRFPDEHMDGRNINDLL